MEEKTYCAVTNLPIISYSEWIDLILHEEFKVSFYLIGDCILQTVPAGACAKIRRSSLLDAREQFLKKIGLWDKPHIEIEDYHKIRGLPSRESRADFTNFLINEEKRGKLFAYFGYNAAPPLQWIFNISLKPLIDSSWANMVDDYKTAVEKAYRLLIKQVIKNKEDGIEKKVIYTKKDIEQYVDELLKFMESLTWYKNNMEIKEIDASHPFKILYDVIAVIKMDFQAILANERKNNELIKSNEEKYRLLSENLQDVIYILDTELVLKSIAGNTLSTLGYDRPDLLTISGDDLFSLFHPNDAPRVVKEIKNTLNNGNSVTVEARLKQKDNSYRWLELSFAPLYDETAITGIHGFARNIEHHKKTEEKLNSIQQQLVETALSAGKVELSTGILHDIGNILNSVNICTENLAGITNTLRVSGFLQANELLMSNIDHIGDFLKNDPKGRLLPEYYCQLGENIKSSQDRLKSEVEQLKTKVNTIKEVIFTQQKYGKLESLLEKFDLCSTIEDALILQGSFLKKNGIQVDKMYNENDKIMVKAQRSKLIHVLINVLKNAAEAMLDIELEKRKIVICINQTPDIGITIIVSDNGMGIEAANLENIFLYGMTTKSNGHGFGLHTSKNYIAEMGGKLYAKSDGLGKGTALYIDIPAYILK